MKPNEALRTIIKGTFRMVGQVQSVIRRGVCLRVCMRTNTGRTRPLCITGERQARQVSNYLASVFGDLDTRPHHFWWMKSISLSGEQYVEMRADQFTLSTLMTCLQGFGELPDRTASQCSYLIALQAVGIGLERRGVRTTRRAWCFRHLCRPTGSCWQQTSDVPVDNPSPTGKPSI